MNRSNTDIVQFIKLIFLLMIFRVLIDYGYWKFVYTLFDYNGFTFSFNIGKILISWILMFLVFFVIFIKKSSPLIYIYFIIFTTSLIPIMSYYALSGVGVSSFWMSTIVFLFCAILLPKSKYMSLPIMNINKSKQDFIIYFLMFLCVLNLIYLIYMSGGRFILSFADVYEYRSENVESYAGLFGYLNNWSTKVLVPFIIAVSLATKRKNMLILSILICFSFYAFTGHKSILLPLILCLFLSKVFKESFSKEYFYRFSIICFIGLISFSIAGICLFLISQEIAFGSVFFRRTFFVPAYLNNIYFEMFSNGYNPIYWSNSIFSSYIYYPYYDVPITKVVGAYLNQPDMGANTGFVASGFMQAKYYGIFLYTFIVIIINYFITRVSHRINPIIFNSVLLMPFLTIFSSSDLFTGMLTHGLMFAVFILYLYSGILKFRN